MILTIFVLLHVLAVLCVLFGWNTERPWLTVFGYVLLFITGINLFIGIDYETGVTITEVGGDTIITNNYTSYSNNTLGIMYAIAWAFMFIQTLLEFRPRTGRT